MANAGGFLADVNDHWLKPRLLRVVVGERLPQPGGDVPPEELASILEAVRMHGLLTESLPDSPDPKLTEAWRAAVDVWVERVGELVETDSVCCPLLPTLLIWAEICSPFQRIWPTVQQISLEMLFYREKTLRFFEQNILQCLKKGFLVAGRNFVRKSGSECYMYEIEV